MTSTTNWPPPHLGTVTPPPYNLSKLHPPLTKIQRAALLQWSQHNGYTLPQNISDANLIARCQDLAKGNIAGSPSLKGNLANIGESAFGAATVTLSVAEFLGKLAAALFDPHFWLRVAEFTVGAVLIGVGLSHISAGADNAIKSIPVYGKVVNRAMHPAPRRAYQGRHSV